MVHKARNGNVGVKESHFQVKYLKVLLLTKLKITFNHNILTREIPVTSFVTKMSAHRMFLDNKIVIEGFVCFMDE